MPGGHGELLPLVLVSCVPVRVPCCCVSCLCVFRVCLCVLCVCESCVCLRLVCLRLVCLCACVCLSLSAFGFVQQLNALGTRFVGCVSLRPTCKGWRGRCWLCMVWFAVYGVCSIDAVVGRKPTAPRWRGDVLSDKETKKQKTCLLDYSVGNRTTTITITVCRSKH